jgi:carbon starvation protein
VVLWVVIFDMLRLCARHLAGKRVPKLSETPHEPSRLVENWVRD